MGIQKGMSNIRGEIEREEALECWGLLHKNEFTRVATEHFNDEEAEIYFNEESGNVFLCDDDYNTLMVNDGELDLFITLSEGGAEGFLDDLIDELKDGYITGNDLDQLKNYLTDEQKEELKIYFVEAKL